MAKYIYLLVGGLFFGVIFWKLFVFGKNNENQLGYPEEPGEIAYDICSGMDFGKGNPGEIIRKSFNITNNSKFETDFDIRASCGCLQIEPMNGKLPAGDSKAISVTMKVGGRGTSQSSVVSVTSGRNTEKENTKQFSMTVKSPPLLDLGANRHEFGQVTVGKSRDCNLEIIDSLVSTQDIEIIYKKSLVSEVKFSCLESGKKSVYIQTRSDLPPGLYTEIIQFCSKIDSNLNGEFAVSMEVDNKYRASPTLLEFNGDNIDIGLYVIATRSDGELISPLTRSDDSDNFMIIDVSGPMPTYRRRIKVLPKGRLKNSGNISLVFGGEIEPLILTYDLRR